jgi:hypothetical protein
MGWNYLVKVLTVTEDVAISVDEVVGDDYGVVELIDADADADEDGDGHSRSSTILYILSRCPYSGPSCVKP